MPSATRPLERRQSRILDPESQRTPKPFVDEDDDASVSSASSNSSSSRDFVEDSTAFSGVSSAKQSRLTAESSTSKWLDDNANITRSTALVVTLLILAAVSMGSVAYVVSKNQDEKNFHNKVSSVERFRLANEGPCR